MSDEKRMRQLSRFLSLVLRHRPERIGVQLDAGGWVAVDALLDGIRGAGRPVDLDELRAVVAGNDKQRFVFSTDGRRLRASQGHSLPVDLGLAARVPPDQLYHGTARRVLPSIRREGLTGQGRNHVHLSDDRTGAVAVGRRHGAPVVLTVAAGELHRTGQAFYRSANGVWLTASVPPRFLS